MYSGFNSLKNHIFYNGPNKGYNKFGYIPQYPPQPYNALLPYPQPSHNNSPLYSPPP